MESNNKLKEIYIKSLTCYSFEDVININVLYLDDNVLDEKSYEI